MRKIYAFAILLFMFFPTFGQQKKDKISNAIVKEGKLLYRQEMASWYGTDIFLERYAKKENIGGYFSYLEEDSAKCIFFSKSENPKVIGTITFDETYESSKATANLTEREFSELEYEYFLIRANAINQTKTDTLFKFYKNYSLNFIPVITDTEKKVYVITGPKETGIVIFGNDYLLTFDKNKNLISSKRLHKNIIINKYTNDDNEVGSMHSHLPESGDFITATDICTLMLYGKFTKWKTYNVLSNNYFSIWDIKKNDLTVITRAALDNIMKDQQERHPKGNN